MVILFIRAILIVILAGPFIYWVGRQKGLDQAYNIVEKAQNNSYHDPFTALVEVKDKIAGQM